ncbi:MAG TPA: SRPBCC family protein, partial [Pirellulales bacterium]|nr:SRPBCC family protein [Pirellulales bacterium]
MFKKILIVLLVIVGGLAIAVAMQPDETHVQRSTTVDAPASVVFDQVNDFHNWQAWSPWAKMDPDAKNSFEGPESGKDAAFSWSGNHEVGEGKMTIVESKPSELVRIKLEFTRPMKNTCSTLFTFKPEGDKTTVTWDMTGKNDFRSKAVCLVMNMDKAVGAEFDKGLASMKA